MTADSSSTRNGPFGTRLTRRSAVCRNRHQVPTSINGKGLKYMIESWRRMFEFGALFGPTKLSLLYAYLPGPDRRGGYLYDNQSCFQAPGQGCYGVFRPYSYLLGYVYGAGVNAYDTGKNGYINAAEVLATRLDYAMAANLNLFGSFLWAQRSSNGYSWGYLRPAFNPTVTSTVNATANGIANFIKWTPYVCYQNNDRAPNTPERDLGWEVTAGFEWMLLERYKLRSTSCLLAAGEMVQVRLCRQRGCRVEPTDQDELDHNSHVQSDLSIWHKSGQSN